MLPIYVEYPGKKRDKYVPAGPTDTYIPGLTVGSGNVELINLCP